MMKGYIYIGCSKCGRRNVKIQDWKIGREREICFSCNVREKFINDSYLFSALSPREKQVVSLRYGIEDGKPKSFEEIGRIMGVTRERIRQIDTKILIKIEETQSKASE